MPSPNLAITHVAAAQNQKEVTINDAVDALDAAMCDELIIDFAAGDVTLTDAQFRSAVAFRGDHLTVARNVTVPAVKRLFVVNNADGGADLTVVRGTTTLVVPTAGIRLLYCDGTADGLFGL